MSEQHVLAIGFLERATCSAKRFIVFVIGVLAFLPISTSFCNAAPGTVVAWGYNCCGQTDIPPNLTNVTAISAGAGSQSFALKEDGTSVGWGLPATPVLTNVFSIAGGTDHGLALQSNGNVIAWGTYFVSGGGSMPAFVPSDLSNVTAIASGAEHDLALRSDGTVAVWGSRLTFSNHPSHFQTLRRLLQERAKTWLCSAMGR